MNELEKDIALLESYLEGKLGESEKQAVEDRIANEEDFKKLSSQLEVLIAGINYAGSNNLLGKLKDIESGLPPVEVEVESGEDEEAKVVPMKRRNTWWYAAASVVVVILCSIFLFKQKATPGELFTDYMKHYGNIDSPTTRGEVTDLKMYQKAYAAYDQHNYELAIDLFNQTPEPEMDSTKYLYLGISYLMNDQGKEAINSLGIAKESAGNLENKIHWYLGLAYLNTGELEQAKKYLTLVKQNGSSGDRKMASELLEQL